MRNNLYVGNLVFTEDRELEDLLSRFGTVRFAALFAGDGAGFEGAGDGAAGGRRFGVVEMQSDAEAQAAMRVLDGFEIRGGTLTVRRATAAEQTACGHPAMFGTMNLCNGDAHDGRRQADRAGADVTPTDQE